MPAHQIEEALDEYLVRVDTKPTEPIFQSVTRTGTALTGRALNRHNAWIAIRKRARQARFLIPMGCHTWRLRALPPAWRTAAGWSRPSRWPATGRPGPPKLYDRTRDEITLSELERIRL
jgi:hypothetical protein